MDATVAEGNVFELVIDKNVVDKRERHVVIEEIIPESQLNKNKGLIALLTLVGFSIMMILDVALG